jgi:hypothetical protein
MLVKPNKTVVEAKVRAVRPREDGWGADVDFEVLRNVSPSPESDFLRPRPGSVLTVFTAEPEKVKTGELVCAETKLLAGPGGGRAVLESAERIDS